MRPHHINDVLIPAEQILARGDELVDEMLHDCRGDDFVMIGILRGSFIFLADLVRDLYEHGVHPRIDFITMESYGSGTRSSGQVTVTKDIAVDVQGAEILLVDDILDSGRTLTFAKQHLLNKGAQSVKTCTLLDKPGERVVQVQADYRGFEIGNDFVVGYGLDYDSHYRELPYIAKVTFTD